MKKERYVHFFNTKNNKDVMFDRRSENLRFGKLRQYENITPSSRRRLLNALDKFPCGLIIYPDGYSITQKYGNSSDDSYVIFSGG